MSDHIVFLGNSLTHGGDWARLLGLSSISNHGVPGETTRDILRRLHIVKQEPMDRLFFMAGINDLSQRMAPDEIVANTREIVREIHSSHLEASIYVQSVLPVNHDMFPWAPSAALILATNSGLREMHLPEQGIHFVNVHDAFLDERHEMKAEFTDDGVHLTPAGYEHWAGEIRRIWLMVNG